MNSTQSRFSYIQRDYSKHSYLGIISLQSQKWRTSWAVQFFIFKLQQDSSPFCKLAYGIIIIIIKSCRQNGYPWPSLATSPHHSSLLAGLQGYILYPHIAAVCMFELVVLLLLGHRSASLMSSSLLLQQCPACLVHLTCIVFVMGGKWPHSCCFVGCWRQDLFNIALNILV